MRLGMYPYICWSAHIEATRYFPKGLPEWTAVVLLYILMALQVAPFSLLECVSCFLFLTFSFSVRECGVVRLLSCLRLPCMYLGVVPQLVFRPSCVPFSLVFTFGFAFFFPFFFCVRSGVLGVFTSARALEIDCQRPRGRRSKRRRSRRRRQGQEESALRQPFSQLHVQRCRGAGCRCWTFNGC